MIHIKINFDCDPTTDTNAIELAKSLGLHAKQRVDAFGHRRGVIRGDVSEKALEVVVRALTADS